MALFVQIFISSGDKSRNARINVDGRRLLLPFRIALFCSKEKASTCSIFMQVLFLADSSVLVFMDIRIRKYNILTEFGLGVFF